MESLPTLERNLTAGPPTVAAYKPLLTANSNSIRSTVSATFAYGTHARHVLDVYYPTKSQSAHISPVLIFIYGGGLIHGDRRLTSCSGLAYANIGHFFAENYNFTVVIPDYRLIEHKARFPSGGEDVALAIKWATDKLATPDQPRDLYVVGQSAGGIHVSTFLFAPQFLDTREGIMGPHAPLRLRAVVQISVPFSFEQQIPERVPITEAYYESEINAVKNSPIGLLRQAKPLKDLLREVRFLVATSDFDTNEILDCTDRFREAWGDESLDTLCFEGHNHISPSLSLGTAIEKEEKWGHQIGGWLLTPS